MVLECTNESILRYAFVQWKRFETAYAPSQSRGSSGRAGVPGNKQRTETFYQLQRRVSIRNEIRTTCHLETGV